MPTPWLEVIDLFLEKGLSFARREWSIDDPRMEWNFREIDAPLSISRNRMLECWAPQMDVVFEGLNTFLRREPCDELDAGAIGLWSAAVIGLYSPELSSPRCQDPQNLVDCTVALAWAAKSSSVERARAVARAIRSHSIETDGEGWSTHSQMMSVVPWLEETRCGSRYAGFVSMANGLLDGALCTDLGLTFWRRVCELEFGDHRLKRQDAL